MTSHINGMLAIASRNTRVFFRDRSNVFFSLLSVLIALGIYALFLSRALSGGGDSPQAALLRDSWMVAGLVAMASVSTTLGALGALPHDRQQLILQDFYASPLPRRWLVGGYLCSTVFIGFVISGALFAAAQAYLALTGGALLPPLRLLAGMGVIALSVLSSTALVLLLISFLHSPRAYGTASSVLATLIGFLAGVYIPVGSLPGVVQSLIFLFPPAHAASLLRQLMLDQPMAAVFSGFTAEAAAFAQEMGITIPWGGGVLPPVASAAYLLLSTAALFALSVLHLSRKRGEW